MKRKILKKTLAISIVSIFLMTGFTTFVVGTKTNDKYNPETEENVIKQYTRYFRGLINNYEEKNYGTDIYVIIGMQTGLGGPEFPFSEWFALYDVNPEDLGLSERGHNKLQWFTAASH